MYKTASSRQTKSSKNNPKVEDDDPDALKQRLSSYVSNRSSLKPVFVLDMNDYNGTAIQEEERPFSSTKSTPTISRAKPNKKNPPKKRKKDDTPPTNSMVLNNDQDVEDEDNTINENTLFQQMLSDETNEGYVNPEQRFGSWVKDVKGIVTNEKGKKKQTKEESKAASTLTKKGLTEEVSKEMTGFLETLKDDSEFFLLFNDVVSFREIVHRCSLVSQDFFHIEIEEKRIRFKSDGGNSKNIYFQVEVDLRESFKDYKAPNRGSLLVRLSPSELLKKLKKATSNCCLLMYKRKEGKGKDQDKKGKSAINIDSDSETICFRTYGRQDYRFKIRTLNLEDEQVHDFSEERIMSYDPGTCVIEGPSLIEFCSYAVSVNKAESHNTYVELRNKVEVLRNGKGMQSESRYHALVMSEVYTEAGNSAKMIFTDRLGRNNIIKDVDIPEASDGQVDVTLSTHLINILGKLIRVSLTSVKLCIIKEILTAICTYTKEKSFFGLVGKMYIIILSEDVEGEDGGKGK